MVAFIDDAGVITVPPAAEAEVVEVCAEAWLESERRRVRAARKCNRSSIMRLLIAEKESGRFW